MTMNKAEEHLFSSIFFPNAEKKNFLPKETYGTVLFLHFLTDSPHFLEDRQGQQKIQHCVNLNIYILGTKGWDEAKNMWAKESVKVTLCAMLIHCILQKGKKSSTDLPTMI